MIVNYKPVSGGSYSLLYNEANGDANEDFVPSFRDRVQKTEGYGAASSKKVAQSNTDGSVTFKWSSNYATPDAAAAAIASLRATFKGIPIHLQVIVGATTLYLPNANLSASCHKQRGRECVHTFTFETDDITTTAV